MLHSQEKLWTRRKTPLERCHEFPVPSCRRLNTIWFTQILSFFDFQFSIRAASELRPRTGQLEAKDQNLDGGRYLPKLPTSRNPLCPVSSFIWTFVSLESHPASLSVQSTRTPFNSQSADPSSSCLFVLAISGRNAIHCTMRTDPQKAHGDGNAKITHLMKQQFLDNRPAVLKSRCCDTLSKMTKFNNANKPALAMGRTPQNVLSLRGGQMNESIQDQR